VKVPEVSDDRILVKIEAASLCSSDLAAYKRYMSFMTSVPYCGGHERRFYSPYCLQCFQGADFA
jgi:threonine dehydrogenase-like Zn-dependent dehydrogenase